ncbi:MAG: radical SAM protein [Synergistaceae bacterium]|jgi:MoaA/NifB/PqqE/SkfB family radical SAM enzyme|nr:radical SAM protein [Synergistaceae bacterium]
MLIDEKKEREKKRRAKLKDEKPLAYEKIMKYQEKRARGESTAIIDFAYDYSCNLHCKHCMNSKIKQKGQAMTIDTLKNIARQADELGLAQFNIAGGEPLVFKEIDDIICALMPDKFHISMSTNGMFLDLERAIHLKTIGLDKVKISIDSIDEKKHNANRNQNGAFRKALSSLQAAKEAGLDVIMQHVVTHQTARSKELIDLFEYAKEHEYTVDLMIARALGEWEGRHDVLIDDEDARTLLELHEKYPFARRDVFPQYGLIKGCGTVDAILHITKYGDVQPCVYMQIAIGNIFEESLKEIIDRGFNIKHFRNFSSKCLSGEDKDFIARYMDKCINREIPVYYKDIFTVDDYIDPSKM